MEPLPAIGRERPLPPCSTMPVNRSIFSSFRDYLGHKQLSSTQSYLQVDPTKLANRGGQRLGTLEQNLATIEVLLDQEAMMSGAAARAANVEIL